MRARLMATVASTLAFLLVVGGQSTSQAADGLTVAYYGGSWGETIQKCITDPFTKATGIKVTPEPGVSSVTIAKLRQEKGNPAIDIAWMDGGISELASAEGLVAAIDPKKVPNVANMIPEGIYKNANSEIYALSTGYYALGLVYNSKEVKTPPSSWQDLWKPDYAGVVTVPAPSNAMGVPFIALINKLAGGTLENLQPGMAKLKSLKVSSFYDTSGAADNSFQGGDAVIGAHYAQAGWAMADKGLPIAYAVPKEGAPSGDIRVHIVKGTPKLDDAEKFVDFAVGKEPATCMAETIYVGPATKGVVLSDKAKQRMPWGPTGSVENLALSDWIKLNAARASITDSFNRDVVGK
jgi:putative spermidine/putrescine transport system substrate-binding protein